jgi:hypothetical protein
MALDSIEQKATSVIAELELFDFDQFQRKFYKNEQLRVDVYAYFDLAISEYKLNGQIGTSSNYSCSKNSIKAFKDKLAFWEITPEFLTFLALHFGSRRGHQNERANLKIVKLG